MDPRARFQALQAHLSAARFAEKMGDRDTAREEVAHALAIDPGFLAARLLRDQLDGPAMHAATPAVQPAAPTPAPAQPAATISNDTLAQFEERVRQRVRVREAAAQQRHGARRRGARLAAAAAFLAAMSSTSIRESQWLASRSSAMPAPLVEAVSPPALTIDPDAIDADLTAPAAATQPALATVLARPLEQQSAQAVVRPLPAPASAPSAVQALAIGVVTAPPPPPIPSRPFDDRALVEQTLAHYRRAYNQLDARAAQAVYPAVNQPALARAFDGLQSQSLVFDACDVDVRGGLAVVTCRGSSSYVPKIGSREPHVEPRVWNFTLRKDAGDWKIENARAAR